MNKFIMTSKYLKRIVAGALVLTSMTNVQSAFAPISDIDIAKVKDLKSQMICLAKVIHDEARGEPYEGKVAVGNVVLNRTKTWNKTVCEVVFHKRGKTFQFSGMGKRNHKYSKEAMQIAYEMLNDIHTVEDNTNGATYFHADYVNPKWSKVYDKTTTIGRHIFYRSNQVLS